MTMLNQTHLGAVTPAPPPTLATSAEIRDRGSTFVGYVYRAQTTEGARAVLGRVHAGEHTHTHTRTHADARVRAGGSGGEPGVHEVRHVRQTGESGDGDRASGKDTHPSVSGPYVMGAWRCMVVRPGRTGLGGPDDFAVQDGYEDGGERWAGGRVLGVMKREGVIDAVVVVCRWFGGTLLGPVRFTHIETCASEVCRKFKKIEEMDECVRTLKTLDDLLATLRAELATMREQAGRQDSSNTAESSRGKKVPDYRVMQDSLDLTKAKRLIHARECAIKATKTLIEKHRISA